MTDRIRRVENDQVKDAVRRVYYRAILIALVGNAFLLAIKAVAARASGSSAIYADAANSASDLAYSLLMMVGLWLSLRPPDQSHPHGHERIESLVSVAIGGFMVVAGIEALQAGIASWKGPVAPPFGLWLALVPVTTVLIKAGMYLTVKRLGRSVNSPAILATAADHLSDILTSGVVLVGVLGPRLAIPRADPVAGMLVAVWIFYQAGRVILDGVGQLIGRGASLDAERSVIEAVMAVPGVVGIDKAVVEHVGPRLRADIHVYVDGSLTLWQVHAISHDVRAAVEGLDGIDHAFVHVEPADDAGNRPA